VDTTAVPRVAYLCPDHDVLPLDPKDRDAVKAEFERINREEIWFDLHAALPKDMPRGLSIADIRMCLRDSMHLQDLADNPEKQCARVSRILSRFHAHELIAKIPRTQRWRVTDREQQIIAASLCLRDPIIEKTC
jgi:hypothetical protein